MALTTATVSGQLLSPGLTKAAVVAWVEAATDGTRLAYSGSILVGAYPVHVASDGTASVTLPQLPQAGVTPVDAVWRLHWKVGNSETTFDFTLTGDITWDALVDVSDIPITPTLLAQVIAARDAALSAVATLTLVPAPSGDTTGATDTANLASLLAAMGKTVGLVKPTSNPISASLGAGPYYINAGSLNFAPGQDIKSNAQGGTLIYCVGGTSGQVFVKTTDPSFSTSGTDTTSRGGRLAGIILDGSKANGGTHGILRGDIMNSRLDVILQHWGGNIGATAGGTAVTVNARADSTGVTVTSSSPFVADTHTVLADLGAPVSGTGIPANTKVIGLVKGVSFQMGYAAPAAANATASGSQTVQVGWIRNDTITLTSGSNFLPTANAAAGDLGARLFGTGIPLGVRVMAVDPGTGLYMGYPAHGILYQNNLGWCERNDDRIEFFNCATMAAFDGTATFKSDDYCTYDFDFDADHGQVVVDQRGGAALFGITLLLKGGCTARAGTSVNNGVVLSQSGTSRITGNITVMCESAVSGTTQASPHHQADAGSSFQGVGTFWFAANSPATAWGNTKRQVADLTGPGISSVNFHGMIGNAWGFSAAVGFGGATMKHVGPEVKAVGACPVGASTVTVNWETGNVFTPATLVSATAYTVVVDNALSLGAGAGWECVIYFKQAASGTAATVSWGSWPGTIHWGPSGTFQVSATLGSWSAVRLFTPDNGTNWFGSAA